MLIGENLEYYERKFAVLQSAGARTQWNWAAFFGGVFWLLYRKMYAVGLAVFGINVILGLIPVFGSLLILLSWVFLGCMGTSFYRDALDKKVLVMQDMPEDAWPAYAQKHGGTSWGVVILCIVLEIFIIGIASM